MDIIQFLRDEALYLPKSRDTEDFPGFIDNVFNLYLKKLDLINDTFFINSNNLEEEKNKAKQLCNYLKQSIDRYYQGFPSEAYSEFKKGLMQARKYLHYNNIITGELKNLFRMRLGDNHTYKKKEMFHIPYELRAKVNMQRYSIPGLPCLYLGSSVYICWEELGKPDVNSIQVSRLEAMNEKSLKVLDIGYRPTYLAMKMHFRSNGIIQEDVDAQTWTEENIRALIVTWPLIAACSVKVKDRKANFKAEYIIPQLLLQWVRLNKDFDGIRYFSVNPDFYTRCYDLYYNYVFPVKSSSEKGLCKHIVDKFKITETVSWQVAKLCPLQHIHFRDEIPKERFTNVFSRIQLINGISVDYRDTDFGYIENSLRQMEASIIEPE